MSSPTKQSQAIIDAANKAVANITDPAQRAEAKAILKKTIKKLERNAPSAARKAPSTRKDRDADIER